jgi:hypothetical protein
MFVGIRLVRLVLCRCCEFCNKSSSSLSIFRFSAGKNFWVSLLDD